MSEILRWRHCPKLSQYEYDEHTYNSQDISRMQKLVLLLFATDLCSSSGDRHLRFDSLIFCNIFRLNSLT